MARVMLDTNVLYSAIFYPSSVTAKLFELLDSHEIFLTDYSIEELIKNAKKKMPTKTELVDYFIDNFPYILIKVAENYDTIPNLPDIRDPKDRPILASAISDNMDYLISGDKDFLVLDTTRPSILSMQEFIEKFK